MQIPIVQGIYTSEAADIRVAYPRNMIPVPQGSGVSNGYLRPADGIVQFGTGPGIDRGGINWKGTMYRVMGTKLVSVSSAGAVTVLGDVGGSNQVTFDYSFDRLAIASNNNLFYWDGGTLSQVTDGDLGTVVDVLWVDGYFMTTDGENLVVTELTDPFAVNPLKYGSSEADPDPVVSLLKMRNEVYALNRYTIEVFENVGGDLFPFQRIPGALVPRGCIGTHACQLFAGTIALLGSARNEAPSIYLLAPGNTQKIATREIDQILKSYTEQQLSLVVMEARVDKDHQHLHVNLPDQTLVYDATASQALGQPIWFVLTTSIVDLGAYRARNLVYAYDKWLAGDPTSASIGELVDTVSSHYGDVNGWDFGTPMIYNEGNGAIVHELELVGLPGRVALGDDPVVWTSYSLDGETFSQERSTSAGKQGERQKRIAWRRQGSLQNYRIQKFRGTSDAHISFARLEAKLEALFTRPA